MEQLIKFQMLFDSLNQTEQKIFILKIINLCGMNLIKTALFTYFARKIVLNQPYNVNNVNTINKALSDIIHARSEKSIETIAHQDEDEDDDILPSSTPIIFKFDEIPAPLISNIASFLERYDYLELQQANRRVYIGCNSPFSVTASPHLHPDEVPGEELTTALSKYITLSSLDLNMEYYEEYDDYSTFNLAQFPHLRKLKLSRCTNGDLLETFIEQNDYNLPNIQELHLHLFGKHGQSIPNEIFCSFLSIFPNLQRFKQSGGFYVAYHGMKSNTPSLPALEAMSIRKCDSPLLNAIITKYNKQIKSINMFHNS